MSAIVLPGLEDAVLGDSGVDAEEPLVGMIWRIPEKRQWMVECEPHVMRVLKRFFERIPKDTPTGRAPLADSPANCRDLLWFMGRHQLQISPENLAHLKAQAEVETKRQRSVTRILTGKYTPTAFKVGIEPWPFQYLPAELTLAAGGHLCADEVGLGKTLEGALLISDPRARPSMVVCPTQIVSQWQEKLALYLPGARVHVLKKRTPYDLPDPFPDVLICTYAKLAGWASVLAPRLASVVYDEAHNLCHEWGPPPRRGEERKRVAKYEAALHLRDHVRYRMALSGTPIKGYGGEFRVVMNVVLPDAIGTEQEFGREWCRGATGEKATIEDPRALGAQMVRQGLMTSRTRAEVGRHLPPVTIHTQPVEVDMKRLNAVKLDTLGYAKTLLRHGIDPEEKLAAARDIDWKLRHATGLAKAPAVIEFVKIIAARSPVLLLGWHIDFWREMAKGLWELKPVFFTGQQSAHQKKQAVDQFLAGDSQVFCMSHRAAEGIDGLQKVCSTVVCGELDWSYSIMLKQNVGRLQREGQRENVFVHLMLADDGSDPYIASALGIKRGQLEGILRPDAPLVEEVQADPRRVREMARAWLASHDPKALAAIEREIAEAEQAKLDEKEARRARRKGGGGAPISAAVPPAPETPTPEVDVVEAPAEPLPPAPRLPPELVEKGEPTAAPPPPVDEEGPAGAPIPLADAWAAPERPAPPPAPAASQSAPSSTATSSPRTHRRRRRTWQAQRGSPCGLGR